MIVKIAIFEYIVDDLFMLSNYHTFAYLASILPPHLEGMEIGKLFSQEKDQLALTCTGKLESLIISCQSDANALYLHARYSRARTNSADVLRECWGERIRSIAMHPCDRVIDFQLHSGKMLCAQFFGPKANVVFVDPRGIILDAFKDAKNLRGTERESKGGELVYDFEVLRAAIDQADGSPVARVLKDVFPTLGATLVQEVLCRAQVQSSVVASDITPHMFIGLRGAISSLLTELSHPVPRVYLRPGDRANQKATPVKFSLIRLHHLERFDEKLFDDVHDAIRFFVAQRRRATTFEDEKARITSSVRQQLEKFRRTLAAIDDDLQKSMREEEYQRAGDFIMAHLGTVEKGAASVTLRSDHGEVVTRLDPSLTAAQNAQRYYEKAKRSRRARHQAIDRLAELRSRIETGGRILTRLNEIETEEVLKQFVREHETELNQFGIGKKHKSREELPFRIFTVEGGFQVLVGKSSTNNDLLTMKHAKPNDLWFHTRGASGSHVVLKVGSGKGEPSKRAKEQAAAIAAYYSKMKKAKHVPVAMSERKYVRKPKGSSPGTVVLEREKVLFVHPGLPDGQ